MKVQLSGRLGNQLFQIAHGLSRHELGGTDPEFFWDIYSYPKGVSNEVLQIPYINLRRDNIRGFLLKSLDKLRSYSTFAEKTLCRALRIEREHNRDKFLNPYLITGYFQDFQWAEISYPKLMQIHGLMSDMNTGSEIEREFPNMYQVFHYRCGDYFNHPANFGILSPEYYQRNMHPDLPVVIVTDSLDFAKEKFTFIENVRFIDPDKANPWQAISIISKASHVVSSNSTLSWWGSFFAMKSGKIAVLPVPFFANGNSVNLYHPKFTFAEAIFD
jgi:hypothetical protein